MKTTNSRTALTVVMKALALPALLVLALAMLAPGGTNSTEPGFAPGDQPAPENWAAVGWQEVSKVAQDSLKRAWYGGHIPTGEDARSGKIESWVSIPHGAGHPLLDTLLPGARIYHVAEQLLAYEFGVPAQHRGMLYYSGHFYRLDRLNYLLRDAGFKFDTTEMAAIAKIAVLFTLASRQAERHQTYTRYGPPPDWVKPDSADLATAFPAVEFRKVGWGEWRHPTQGDTRGVIRTEVTVKEGAVEYVIGVYPGSIWPNYILGDGVKADFLPPPRPSSEGPGAPEDGGDGSWQIEVFGDTWTEVSPGDTTHYFAVVDTNGGQTNDTLGLRVGDNGDTILLN